MANAKDWLVKKFSEWEKLQGNRQSYYAFARYLEVSQSGLSQWMVGSSVPSGDDLVNVAGKLGPEIYDVLGLPRPNSAVQQALSPLASLPPDIREKLTNALAESEQWLRQERLQPESPEARAIVLKVLAKWGFRYTG